jgi:hypothetical protein
MVELEGSETPGVTSRRRAGAAMLSGIVVTRGEVIEAHASWDGLHNLSLKRQAIRRLGVSIP